MAAIINTIANAVVTSLKAITPDVRRGQKFNSSQGSKEPLFRVNPDSGADRAFRVVPLHDDVELHAYGGNAAMYLETIMVYVAYLAQGKDQEMHERLSADKHLIRQALNGLFPWPVTSEGSLSSLELQAGASVYPLDEGANVNIYQIPLICQYEVEDG